jgi:hypothetical protein
VDRRPLGLRDDGAVRCEVLDEPIHLTQVAVAMR